MSNWSVVQKPMLDYATQIGWERISQQEALRLRGDETGLYFVNTLHAQLLAHYNLSPSQFGDVSNKVQHRPIGDILADLALARTDRERADVELETVLAKLRLN